MVDSADQITMSDTFHAAVKEQACNHISRLYVVVPAYNEETVIASVIADLATVVAPEDIVVIDDGSSDSTALIAQGAGATVLRHLINRGQARQ